MSLFLMLAMPPLNSYDDLSMRHNLQFEKHPTIVIALFGSSGQPVESKRFGALDFEAQGPTEMTVIYFKTCQHRQ